MMYFSYYENDCIFVFLRLQALSKALTENELFYLNTQFRLLEPKGGSLSLENFKVVGGPSLFSSLVFQVDG